MVCHDVGKRFNPEATIPVYVHAKLDAVIKTAIPARMYLPLNFRNILTQ